MFAAQLGQGRPSPGPLPFAGLAFCRHPKPLPIQNIEAVPAVVICPSIFSASLALDARATASALAKQRFSTTSANVVASGPRYLPPAHSRGEVVANPCSGLQLPAVRGRRERYATPAEAEALIGVLPVADRPIWATAMYGGLRGGELQALRAEDVELANGVIRVEFGLGYREGQIPLKSDAGRRKVPISAVLRDFLDARLTDCGYSGSDRFFGLARGASPFDASKLTKRADRAWRDARLGRITLHECRHTFASLMIAAGVNAKALQSFMGHANISITLDRYGHLMPGSEAEAASLLDTYLSAQRERDEEAARSAGAVLAGAPAGA